MISRDKFNSTINRIESMIQENPYEKASSISRKVAAHRYMSERELSAVFSYINRIYALRNHAVPQSVQAENDEPPLIVVQGYIPFFFHEVSSFSCDGFIVMERVGKDECADFKSSERKYVYLKPEYYILIKSLMNTRTISSANNGFYVIRTQFV